ncbi:ATPase [Micromonospora sp. NPDC018662]|uniref:ATPase n=1 Tax=Micromonospora sp. NPDC018662 TaxID=3364238 RepID=UPI0037AEAD6A
MRFSVVEAGYDRRQVDACLDELDLRLRRLAARAEGAAGAGREWDRIRLDAGHLCDYLRRRAAPVDGAALDGPSAAAREAADLLARARAELDAARAEAHRVRDEAYAEAVRARREFEAALLARRRHEARVDEILAGARVPADTPTAAAGR